MSDPRGPDRAARSFPGRLSLTAAQTRYHLRLAVRSRRSLLAGVLLPVLVLLTRGTSRPGPALVGGLAALGVISAAFVGHATGLVLGRESGVLRRWRMSPLPSGCYLAGTIAATVVVADTGAILTVVVAALTGSPAARPGALWVLLPITAGALTWSVLGTAVTTAVPTADAAYPLLTLVYLPVVVLSGGLGPPAGPSWLRTATEYLPARPVITTAAEALRHPGAGPLLAARPLGVLAGWSIAGLVVAICAFRWEPYRGGRPGFSRRVPPGR